jgi:Transposase family tnp2
MEVERIHVCPNNFILYRNEYSEMNRCSKCKASQYKLNDDQAENENDDETNKSKRAASKVLWYLPILPRIECLFSNERDAKLLQWHTECRKEDGLLRHPTDSPEWRNINREWADFKSEIRNLRLGLCTDGMNLYGNMSSSHSTWPVLLCVYNLSPWLCMKRKYLMMSLLISDPKQPDNDIDAFLAPLVEDLNKLWTCDVRVYDAYMKEYFIIRAMIF